MNYATVNFQIDKTKFKIILIFLDKPYNVTTHQNLLFVTTLINGHNIGFENEIAKLAF